VSHCLPLSVPSTVTVSSGNVIISKTTPSLLATHMQERNMSAFRGRLKTFGKGGVIFNFSFFIRKRSMEYATVSFRNFVSISQFPKISVNNLQDAKGKPIPLQAWTGP
jgi:ribosomal protein S1